MRELTTNEIEMVSAGPTATAAHAADPLALAGLCNVSTSTLSTASPGLFPAAGIAFISNDALAIAK